MIRNAPLAAGSANPATPPVPAGGSMQLAIANALVRTSKDLFGRGPTRARVILHGNIVVCLLADCLTQAERALVENGCHDAVVQQRHAMHKVARPQVARIVEQFTGRRVASCTAGLDLDAGEQVVTCRLDGPVDGTADEA